MNFFSNNPFIKLLGFWIIGLLSAKYVPALLYIFILLFFAGSIWLIVLGKHKQYPFDLVASILLSTTILLLSALNYRLSHPTLPQAPAGQTHLLASVVETPQEKPNSYQAILKIVQADNDSLIGYQVITWFEKDSNLLSLRAGDLILASTKLQTIANKGNPFEFDYKSYMAQQGIHYRCYIAQKNCRFTQSYSSGLRLWAENFRLQMLHQLRAALSRPESFEIISALTLGYRKELSPETRESFTKTGAMHVLAVSGLHVGLIFLFLLKVFHFLTYIRGGQWIRLLAISVILWTYALLTGFSPSVQRATTMFSFLLIAETINRRNSIYNSIAASAFALLLLNPDILFAVGFQLSYAAVLSIVYFYPLLNKLLPQKPAIIRKPGQLLCVALSAQIGTFPLTIYYFNQFPIYFWLSNFVVIPAAFVLLCGTFLFFVSAAIAPVQSIVATILDLTSTVVLFILDRISKLPGAVITHIAISETELACLTAMIIFVILFIQQKRARYVKLALFCLLLFQTVGLSQKLSLFNQHRVIEYQNVAPILHLIDGRSNYILCTDTATISPYMYTNVITRLQLNQPVIVQISDSTSFRNNELIIEGDNCQFGNQTIPFPHPQKKTKWQNSHRLTSNKFE